MDIDLSAFHFLRPVWLACVPLGLLFWWAWRRAAKGASPWRGAIAPALLAHLMVKPAARGGWRPIHALALLWLMGGVAAAGPTWRQEPPPFAQDQAPLMLAVALDPSMDAADVPPSRLEAAKHMLRDLIQRRAGAPTGLLVYSDRAHTVLPPTDDPALLDLFLQALSTDLLATSGHDAAVAIAQAQRLLVSGNVGMGVGGTVLLVTDGADAASLPEAKRLAQASDLQLLVLAVGASDQGMLRDQAGKPRADASGRPLLGRFDREGIERLAQATGARLGSLTLNADDLEWIEGHVQRHLAAVREKGAEVHWKDMGYWLCWPLTLAALLAVRRGFFLACLMAVVFWGSTGVNAPVRAGALADAFLTRDQQARWAFEHGRPAAAAALFEDAYWKGRAAYEAADFELALASFARVETAEGFFYVGNTQARLQAYAAAIAAYDEALRRRPDFPEARFNRALAVDLLAALEDEQAQEAPGEKPDKQVFDLGRDKGKSVTVQAARATSADIWLDNLTVSPADFLRRKFALDSQPAAPAATPGGAP